MNREDLTFVRGVVYSNRTVIKNVIMPRTAHKIRCLQVQQSNEFGLIQVEKRIQYRSCRHWRPAQNIHEIYQSVPWCRYQGPTARGSTWAGKKKLKKYAEIHFSYEEQMMDFYGFHELEEHQKLHRNLPIRNRNWKSRVSLEKARQSWRLS